MANHVSFSKLEELSGLVDDRGLVVALAKDLRDAVGWQRLTHGAVSEIVEELAQHGLACYPDIPPGGRLEEVRIYRKGTTVGNIVEAVLAPTELGDKLLRELASGDALGKVQRIRRIVCDD